MPNKMWKPKCPDSKGIALMGTPVCRTCGTPGEYDGWHFGMHELMARYQSHYGLKPIGPHRKMADNLLSGVTVTCHACDGRGLRDLDGGASYEICNVCRGMGTLFAGPLTGLIEIRRRVLEAFPDAAAACVPNFATQSVVHDLSQGTIVNPGAGRSPVETRRDREGSGRTMEEIMPEATLKKAFQVALIRAMVAIDQQIPVKGIGRTPGMKCSAGLLVDWEALAAMEITPELLKGYLQLLASGKAAGELVGCDAEPLNTDEPGFQVWERKLRDKFASLSEADKATWREIVIPCLME